MKKIISIVLCVVMLFGLIGCSSNPEEKISFDKVVIKPNENAGLTTVLGEITNNNKEKHSVEITITFYDEEGNILGIASGTVLDLPGNTTKTFEAYGKEIFPKDSKYKIQVTSII